MGVEGETDSNLARHNYSQELEDGLNRITNIIWGISDGLLSMVNYYKRVEISQIGFSDFFDEISIEHRLLARKLMDYQVKRGGRVLLAHEKPAELDMEWPTPLDSFKHLLNRIKDLNKEYHCLLDSAAKHHDPALSYFVQRKFLTKSFDHIYLVSIKINKLKKVGTTDLGQYMYDRDVEDTFKEE